MATITGPSNFDRMIMHLNVERTDWCVVVKIEKEYFVLLVVRLPVIASVE